MGFVYKIINTDTNQYYIGKKIFTNAIRRKPLKGMKRVRKDRRESNWEEYYGSCNKLLDDIERLGKHKFERRILRFCNSKFELAYWELKAQIEHDVLFDENSYNEILNVRLRRVKDGKKV